MEVKNSFGVGEEIVALTSNNGEHFVEVLRMNEGGEGIVGKEEENQEQSDIGMEFEGLKRHRRELQESRFKVCLFCCSFSASACVYPFLHQQPETPKLIRA